MISAFPQSGKWKRIEDSQGENPSSYSHSMYSDDKYAEGKEVLVWSTTVKAREWPRTLSPN
jgi:hypothetical protein